MDADMLIDPVVPADAERDLVAALAAVSVRARARVLPVRRAAEHLEWMVLIAVPLQAFLSTLGERAGADAWDGLKRAVRRVLGRPDRPGRPILLQDPATGLEIVVPPDLPDDGFRQLAELDLSEFRRGPLRWDKHEGRWLSDLDSALRE